MGVYNMLGDCQIKAGPCDMEHFVIGEKVPLPDGVYVAHEGIVVVIMGVFVGEFSTLTDKWGGEIDPVDVIEKLNPVALGIADALNEEEL